MTKSDGKDVQYGDASPDCFGQVSGCKVFHCVFAKLCHLRLERILRDEVDGLLRQGEEYSRTGKVNAFRKQSPIIDADKNNS